MPKPGGEFSPGQISLRRVLEIASKHDGDRAGAEEAIRAEYYAAAAADRTNPVQRREQQRKRAGNVLIGMATYGLYESGSLTQVGRELVATPSDAALYEAFARHILGERHGLTVVQAVRDIQKRGETPTKGLLSAEIGQLGIELPRATTHHLILIAWLREAGVFASAPGYEIDEARASEVLGVELPTIDEWTALTNQQRAVLRTLKALSLVHGTTPQSAQSVIERAETDYGRIFGMAGDQMLRKVDDPLAAGGWGTMSRPGEGRGGKSGTIAATPKLLDLDLQALPAPVASEIPADLRDKLTTPLQKIYADLDSANTHTKGIALELLAIKIATDLGITARKLRLRGIKTGGAEVDLVAEAAQLHFSRWLFQCKNTSQISVADLAKEIGMCVLLRAHVIVMVTTGKIPKSVRAHAKNLAESTGFQAVLVDGKLLDAYIKRGASTLLEFFHDTAAITMQVKRDQVDVEDETEV